MAIFGPKPWTVAALGKSQFFYFSTFYVFPEQRNTFRSDMCSPNQETHIPSNKCSPSRETNSDVFPH